MQTFKQKRREMGGHRGRIRLAFLLSLIIAITVLAAAFPVGAKASGGPVTATEIDQLTVLAASQQGERFEEMVSQRLKYVTSRSLCGKKGDWLAFVDIYEEYEEGAGTGHYVLQRATLQYGVKPLPDSAKNSTLLVGSKAYYIKAEKQSMFTFPTSPVMDLPESANADAVKVSVSAGKQSSSVTLEERYPHKDFEDLNVVIAEMAESYLTYAEKRDGAFDHGFLRLRSYVSDSDTLDRAYSWELTLLAENELPCKGIVIRYDCDTGKVAAAVNREIRSYFS